MNLFSEKFIRLFELLNKNKVHYILVGGVAVNYYGYSRSTGDIDIWLEDSIENRKNLIAALKEFGIEGAETFLNYPLVAGYAEILLDAGIYIDLMADLVVLKQENFAECFELSQEFNLKGNQIKILQIHKLIEEKSKSNRPKDIEDAEQLKKIL